MGVGGDAQAGAVRFVDDRVEFLVGVLLGADGAAVRITPPDAEILISLTPCMIW